MQTKTYHLICYFLFALALVLIGTIGSAGILVAACAAEDTMGSAVNRLCELHLIVPLVLGIVILLIGLLMLLPQVWPVNLLDRPAEGEEKPPPRIQRRRKHAKRTAAIRETDLCTYLHHHWSTRHCVHV